MGEDDQLGMMDEDGHGMGDEEERKETGKKGA